MARGRMLNQSIAEDVEFNEMSVEAQLMFLRTIPFLDRDGLINGNPSVLRGRIAPLLDLPKSMANIVDEWVNADLIIRYTAGKQTILFFPGFAKNQIGMRYDREATSTYPPPPGYIRTSKGLVAPGESEPQSAQSDDSGNGENGVQPNCELTPDECRMNAGVAPDELPLNGMEWNINIKEKELKQKALPTGVAMQNDSNSSSGLPFWNEVQAAYENNIGTFTPITSELVQDAIKTYGGVMVIDAITEAVKQNVRKWSYVDGILKRQHANGKSPPIKPPPSSKARFENGRELPPEGTRIINMYATGNQS